MRCIIGTKIAMTQVFKDDGTVVPVTRVKAGPCVVTQVKTEKRDGVDAVQIGFEQQKQFRLSKPLKGHLKDLEAVRHLRDFRSPENHGLKRGDIFGVGIFSEGDRVQVVGVSKGKGFQGVVKRHNFKGGKASHGHKDQLRMPGSIGAGGVQRVFKGLRMGGHMGDQQVTVKNLEIVSIDEENNELLIKGAVPGARSGILMISTEEGNIEIAKSVVEIEENKVNDVLLDEKNTTETTADIALSETIPEKEGSVESTKAPSESGVDLTDL